MSPRLVSILARVAGCLRSRAAAVLLVLLILGAMIVTGLLVAESEPSYHRISASDWLELASTNRQKMPEVITAFREMGPAGISFLGDKLLQKTNQVDSWLLTHHQKIPAPLKKFLLKPRHQPLGETVLSIFAGLGTNAAPAIPQIITWLESRSINVYVNYTNPPVANPPVTSLGQRMMVVSSNGIRVTNLFYVRQVTNPFQPYGGQVPRIPPNLVTQKQVIVSAPGVVTTNSLVMVKLSSQPLPRTAFQLLTNFGSDDPRVIPLLLNRVQSITFQSPPPLGTNLRLAALRSVPLLLDNARHPENERRWIALSLLGLTVSRSGAARDYLTQSLLQPERAVFDAAITALQRTTNNLDQLVPIATQSLLRFRNRITDLNGDWRPPIYAALQEFSRHSPLVVPQLQQVLPEADFYEQLGTLQLLGEIGTSDTLDQALITSFTTNSRPALVSAAWIALGKVNRDRVAEAIGQITLLEIGANDQSWSAYLKLGELGSAAQAAVPVLIQHLKMPSTRLVQQAAETLGKIGPAARAALAPLRTVQEHPDADVRATATEAIRLISAAPKASSTE
ncbi:MAG: HEAT repeat domain-containing protein [Verrucomicrobiota bacterium]